MRVKTGELKGVALDWAVENAILLDKVGNPEQRSAIATRNMRVRGELCSYCLNWAQGGSIIEREIANLWKHNKLDPNEPDVWTAAAYHKAPDGTMLYYEDGPTPLIAAMRCFVSSKLGDEVDVPEELT